MLNKKLTRITICQIRGGKSNNKSGNGNNGTAASSESGSGNQPASGESITEKVRNNPAFNEAMRGVTYTSTKATSQQNEKVTETKATNKNDDDTKNTQPKSNLERTKNILNATTGTDLLKNFNNTNK